MATTMIEVNKATQEKTAEKNVKTTADVVVEATNVGLTAMKSMSTQSYLPAYSASVPTITNAVTNNTSLSFTPREDWIDATITREVYADKTLKLILRSPKAVESASLSASKTTNAPITVYALEIVFSNDFDLHDVHSNKEPDIEPESQSLQMQCYFRYFAFIHVDLSKQRSVFINLKLHLRERLMPLFEYLIQKYAVPRNVVESQFIQNTHFFRQETSTEKLFFERLKSARNLPKNGGHSPIILAAASAAGIKNVGLNSGANATVSASPNIDSKTIMEVESIEQLIEEARTIDTAYLKSLLDTDFQPLSGHSSYITTLESLKAQISDSNELALFEESYYKTISEAMYSLSEAYFKQNAYPETLRILAEIPKQDAMRYHADLLKVKTQLMRFKFDPSDQKSLSEQRNIIIQLVKNHLADAEELLESQMCLRYGKSKAELKKIEMSTDTSEFLPDNRTPEAMFDFFDPLFLRNTKPTSSAAVSR